MRSRIHSLSKYLMIALAFLLIGLPATVAGKGFDGRWVFTVTIPESPTSNAQRTFTVTLDVSPRGESLNGRLSATDGGGRTVSGAWRQVGKRISITYELPCSEDGSAPCASVVMVGKMKGDFVKKGTVIVMWDTPSDTNPALYDTSNGKFNGERLQ
ncbi:MAG: hypothetical protein ACJ74J_13255 [Blastocatellia bacterium]